MSEAPQQPKPRIRLVVVPRATPLSTILPVTGYFAAWTIGLYFLDAYALQMALQMLFLAFVPVQLLLQWVILRFWYRALALKKTQRVPKNTHLINSALVAATAMIALTIFGLQSALLAAGREVRHELKPLLAADADPQKANEFFTHFERVWHDAIVRAFSGDPSTSQAEVERLERRLQTFARALEDQSISQTELEDLHAAFAPQSTAEPVTAASPLTAPADATAPSLSPLPETHPVP